MRALPLLLCLGLCACRFGGHNGDALALVEPELDAGADADAGSQSPLDSGAPRPSDGGDTDANAEDGASDAGDTDADTPDGDVEDGGGVDGGGVDGGQCQHTALPGCDPVLRQGCPDGSQCVLNPVASEPTGHCVATALEATPCLESLYTSSCAPGHACIDGACRRFCSCDSDCSDSETCSELLDAVPAGEVKLCATSP